jgi:hypothetical protein
MIRQILLVGAVALSSTYASDVWSELPPDQIPVLVYRLDKSQLNSEIWRKAIATANGHVATAKSSRGGTGFYTLMRVVFKNPEPNERIEVHAVKLKDLKAEYYGGGGALRSVCDGEFVFFEHINGASRRNNQDPVVLRSTVRGANTIWVDVPRPEELQVLGDIIVEHP